MSNGRSREDLLKFHDYLSNKGLIPQATARARKAASKQVLAILDEDEASDVLVLDLDFIMQRFSTLHGQQYNPNSLRDYASRLRASVDDFRAYTENPLSFRPAGRTRAPRSEVSETAPARKSEGGKVAALSPSASTPPPTQSTNILPVRLRENLTIQIAGLPFDLTHHEAQKLANIILAHAPPND